MTSCLITTGLWFHNCVTQNGVNGATTKLFELTMIFVGSFRSFPPLPPSCQQSEQSSCVVEPADLPSPGIYVSTDVDLPKLQTPGTYLQSELDHFRLATALKLTWSAARKMTSLSQYPSRRRAFGRTILIHRHILSRQRKTNSSSCIVTWQQ